MIGLWNKKDLEPPPTNTSQIKIQISDVQNLHKLTTDLLEICNLKTLDEEAALLSRLIYRMKHKFRHDKGFQCMEKTHRALLQYLNVNFRQYLETFSNTIDINIEPGDIIYLPTRQMLEYLLVRTQGFAKLMCRIAESCEITTEYMNNRISSGQSWQLALLILSISCRIYISSCILIYNTCNFYDQMVLYLKMLKPKGVRWLPENYNFPANLFAWLDVKIVDYQTIRSIKIEGFVVNDLANKLNRNNTVNEIDIKCKLIDSIDLGTAISRESFKLFENPQLKNNKNIQKLKQHKSLEIKTKSKHKINSIKDLNSLKQFIKKENKYRKLSNSKSLTKNLDALQWNLVKKLIRKLIKKIASNSDEVKQHKAIVKAKKILRNNI